MIRKKGLVILSMLSLALFSAPPVWANVSEFTLDNGLKLIVKEDHRAPVVVSQIWYRVGSSYEYNGLTGVSHQLEHMMFKGTKTHGPNVFSQRIARLGGKENAFTGRDYTAYFQRLEKRHLAVSFELESDRMKNLLLDEQEFIKERKVITEERRMRTDDKPTSLTYEQFAATAFMNSPYHHPVIGWMEDIHSLDIADLKLWYRLWYSPNNAIVVVAGDVEPNAVYQLAKRYYGALSAVPVIPPKPQREIPQRGSRHIVVKAAAKVPYLLFGYPVPSLKSALDNEKIPDWEPYALEVLAYIIDGGDSARLTRKLIRQDKLATSTSVGYDLYARLQTLFTLSATPVPGTDIPTLQKAVLAEVKRVRNTRVSPTELLRVKAQVTASQVYEQDSLFYQAMLLGRLETVGIGWPAHQQFVTKVAAVTAEQIQQVAQKYLLDDKLTIAELDPQPLSGGDKP